MTDYRAAPTAGAYQTTVQLLRVPLRIDDENQMYFANQTAQNNYFQSVIWKSLPSQTYQRENAYFRVDDDYDAIVTNCNYLRYRNAITGNKWFYAYITEFEYKNPNTTFVHFKIDAYQTYMFDITWKDCYIEREHVKDDSMGKHVLPENFNFNKNLIKHIPVEWPDTNPHTNEFNIVPILLLDQNVFSTELPWNDEYWCFANGIFQGLVMWTTHAAFTESYADNDTLTLWGDFNALWGNLTTTGKTDSIKLAYYVPKFAIKNFPYQTLSSLTDPNLGCMLVFEKGDIPLNDYNLFAPEISKPFDINKSDFNFGGYTPKNNKLYTYQFAEIDISNMQGTVMDLKPELLGYSPELNYWSIAARLSCALSPDTAIFLRVDNYQRVYGGEVSKYFTIAAGNLPTPAIPTDYFSSWLAGNATKTAVSLTSGAAMLTMAAGLMGTGAAPAGAIMALSGGTQIASEFASINDARSHGDPVATQMDTTSLAATGRLGFEVYTKFIQYDQAKAVDEYFTMFGYKVNELKVPEFATRQYYNYYKMPVCNITGNIPQTALDEIRAKFQRGITLWNTPDVGNYRNGNNPIVTS